MQVHNSTTQIQSTAAASYIGMQKINQAGKEASSIWSSSAVAQYAMSKSVSTLSFSDNNTSLRASGLNGAANLSMNQSSSVSIERTKISIKLDISAEELGLTGVSENIQIEFEVEQTRLVFQKNTSSKWVKKNRRADEIISDLAKALRKVLSQKGDKTVSYQLDDEAMQSLMGDSEVMEMLGELVMLMATINAMKQEGNPEHYNIMVSGKGKPTLEQEESLHAVGESKTVNLNLNILANDDVVEPEEEVAVVDSLSEA